MSRFLHTLLRTAFLCTGLTFLAACSTAPRLPEGWPQSLAQLLPSDAILLGEQHDMPEHQAIEQSAVEWLAAQGRLAALVIEMASAGRDTQALAPSADADAVRAALAWDERLWPWQRYAGVVMAAVRAGVPVLGGNLPRADMRSAMQDAALDQRLPAAAYAGQLAAVREGHCDLLPPAQLPGMVRIQIARDLSMARTVAAAPRPPGRTVLLVAGGGHVLKSQGVPMHLPQNLKQKVVLAQSGQAQSAIDLGANMLLPTPGRPVQDACASLRGQPAAPG